MTRLLFSHTPTTFLGTFPALTLRIPPECSALGLLLLLPMFPSLWSKSEEKKRRRVMLEETNRDGHWYRDFSVRTDSWPIVEHWAKEQGYRLVAMKGKRRLYRKGDNPNFYTTFLDIRHDEGRIVMSGWITAGFRLRALSLFLIPEELLIQPLGGWKGIHVRRRATRDFNVLLQRMRQLEILGSNSFHITDIDHSTLFLAAILLIPLHAFLLIHILKLEVQVGLSNILLMNIIEKLQLLLGASISVLILHHFAIAKRFPILWAKLTSVAVFSLLLAGVTIFLGTRTQTENLFAKMTHHCFVSADEEACKSALDQIPAKERESMSQRIELFRKHLTIRNR